MLQSVLSSFYSCFSLYLSLSLPCHLLTYHLITSAPSKVTSPLLHFPKEWGQREVLSLWLISPSGGGWPECARWHTGLWGLHSAEMRGHPRGVLGGHSEASCPLICHSQPKHISKPFWSTSTLSTGNGLVQPTYAWPSILSKFQQGQLEFWRTILEHLHVMVLTEGTIHGEFYRLDKLNYIHM